MTHSHLRSVPTSPPDAPPDASISNDVTPRKSTGDVSGLTETASRIDMLDAATDDILERYRGHYDELARIAGCEKHTVERWGPRGLSRPRSWHVAGMSAGDAKFRAMVAPLFGFDQQVPPAIAGIVCDLIKAARAESVAADVTNLLDSGGK